MKATNETVSTNVGRWIQRIKNWYCSTVPAVIIRNSNTEIEAAAIALQENSKCTKRCRCLHQTAPYNAASVKHVAAFIDQETVIQFIAHTADAQADSYPPSLCTSEF